MIDRSRHLSDREILLFLDREASPTEMERVRLHLKGCHDCSARGSSLEGTISHVAEVYTAEALTANTANSGLRAQLQHELVNPSPRKPQPFPSWVARAGYWSGAVAMMVLTLGICLATLQPGWLVRSSASLAWKGDVPDRFLTPGAVRAVTLEEVCSSESNDLDPDVFPTLEKAVLQEYGVRADVASPSYQIDYLISPQLGGTSDIKNLWPQPYGSREWNARTKDQLERRLHRMVCAGTVDLPTAQHEIATNWIAAYRKYLPGQAAGVSLRESIPNVEHPGESYGLAKSLEAAARRHEAS